MNNSDTTIPPDLTVPPSAILRYFTSEHLPSPLREVSAEFAILAHIIDGSLPTGAEKSVALRKLLEAKDAAVRSALDINQGA